MGVGVVIRDGNGRVLAAKAKAYPYIADPATGEALGAWNAVLLGCQLNLADVILEGDSAIVVTALKRTEVCLASYGNLVDEAKQGLCCMQPVVIQHVLREANQAAHLLAKTAVSQLLDKEWIEECPLSIQNVISAEQ
jgi:hypothetical protein